MKKLVIVFMFVALCCGMTFGQEPQQVQDSIVQPNAVSGKGDNSSGVQPVGAVSLYGRSKKNKDNNLESESSRFDGLVEFGVIGKKVPLFATLGLGLSSVNTSVKISGISKPYTTESELFRMPIYIGYMIGKSDNVHVSVRGGAVRNYLISYKENGNKQDLSGIDRGTWNGTVKFTVSYSFLGFMAEYEFPFESDSKGFWLFGFYGGF